MEYLRLYKPTKYHKSIADDLHNIFEVKLFLAFESEINEMKISTSELNIHFCVDESYQVRYADKSFVIGIEPMLLKAIEL